MDIPEKSKPGRPAKYGLRPGENKRFVRCAKGAARQKVRTGWLQHARLAGVAITTRSVKGGLMIYRLSE